VQQHVLAGRVGEAARGRDGAGSPTGTPSHFESKEALIVELVERYRADLDAIAEDALASGGSDGTPWVNINAVDRFTDEYNIQLAFIRESLPKTVNVGATFSARMGDLESSLAQGGRAGERAHHARGARLAGAGPGDDLAGDQPAGQTTDLTSRYWSKPAVPFCRPTPLFL
jgi:AcrR family transcriptional regulator